MDLEKIKTSAFLYAKNHAGPSFMSLGESETEARRLALLVPELLAEIDRLKGGVIGDIITERAAQDQEWGGPAHGDRQEADEWIDYMARKLQQAHDLIGVGLPSSNDYAFRRRIVQVGALAVACVESLDRHCGKNGGVAL